jgi:hypothetical protein
MRIIPKIFNDPSLIWSALKAYCRWGLSGFKMRTDLQVHTIFHDKCWECPLVNRIEAGSAECTVCGCYLKDEVNIFKLNKIQFKFEKCPEGHWK